MKVHYAAIPVVVIVAVAVALMLRQPLEPVIEEELSEPKVGLGISHYDLSNVTVTGETRLVAARLVNTGDLDINITVSWNPKAGQSADMTVEPSYTLLKAEESVKVYLVVKPVLRGVCEGTVEVQASRTTSEGGNQIVSGGSIDAKISIV